MNLQEYLDSPGAMTVAQLAKRIGVKSEAQVRQWQHGYADRRPGPSYAAAIEKATKGRVRRWDLRPDDWHRIWPDLVGVKGAPSITDKAGAN